MTTLVARALNRPGGRGVLLFERNLMSYRRMWPIIVSGFFEPLFYLLSLGFGLGGYVGEVVIDGAQIDYATFVAPGLLAASAMNGAFYDATNVFWKLKYQKLYDAILSTPLGPKDVATGESVWALFRGLLYAIAIVLSALIGLSGQGGLFTEAVLRTMGEINPRPVVFAMSNPTISRRPSTFTAVATTAETLTTRPPSRTFWVRASIHKYRYGPASSGRSRNSATLASSSPASRDTSELEMPAIPIASTRSSTRRVETPST